MALYEIRANHELMVMTRSCFKWFYSSRRSAPSLKEKRHVAMFKNRLFSSAEHVDTLSINDRNPNHKHNPKHKNDAVRPNYAPNLTS